MSDPDEPTTARRPGEGPRERLGEVARLFLRLGVTAFGGPAAHIAMMHDEVVRRRRWVSDERFVDLVGATNLIPGPNSTELAIHLGWDRARGRGLVLAGACFIAPAALIVGALAWAYVTYGDTPALEGVLYGIKPVTLLRAAAGKRAAVVRPRRKNTYVLSSLIQCGICTRRMQGAWAHDRAYYRCRFPGEYADIQGRHPRSVNVRESAILAGLDRWLAGIFSPHRIEDTCTALAAASEPDPAIRARQDAHRKKLKDCDARLAKYRAALEAGTDPAVVGQWIAEVQAERLTTERALDEATPPDNQLTKDEVRALVEALGDIVTALKDADPAAKADTYRDLGIKLVYHPEGTVEVEARPRVYSGECRRGDTNPNPTRTARRQLSGRRVRCARAVHWRMPCMAVHREARGLRNTQRPGARIPQAASRKCNRATVADRAGTASVR